MADGPHVWESVWNASACSPVTLDRDVSFANGLPWIAVSYANFEGALIKRLVIDRIGFPDVRYFIGGDDTIYGFLASFHARVIYINQFGVLKKIASFQQRSRLHYYLQNRNRFLNREHFESVGVKVPRKPFLVQSLMMVVEHLREILRVPSQRKWVNAKAVLDGFSDGRKGQFGPPPWMR